MQLGNLVGKMLKDGGDSVVLKKVVAYCQSPEFKESFGTEAEAFKAETKQALDLASSGADKAALKALVEKMKETAKQAGDKAVPVAIKTLLETIV